MDFNFTHGFLLRALPADRTSTTPQPRPCNPCRVSHRNGLASSDFARHYSRNHYCFLFLWVLRCFTSPRSLPTPYFIQVQVTGHDSSQVSPFGHPRITARLPTPQGLSQAPTSFIGSRCQGIHHVPFIACHTHSTKHTKQKKLQRCSRPLSTNQKPHTQTAATHPQRTHPTIRCPDTPDHRPGVSDTQQVPPTHTPTKGDASSTPPTHPTREQTDNASSTIPQPNSTLTPHPQRARMHQLCSLERR